MRFKERILCLNKIGHEIWNLLQCFIKEAKGYLKKMKVNNT